jgi:hypothetical protein
MPVDRSGFVTQSVLMPSSPRARRVLELAAELSREEQQHVAAELLAALEPAEELGAEAWELAWREELDRRADDDSAVIPWDEVRERIDARLAQVRAKRQGR